MEGKKQQLGSSSSSSFTSELFGSKDYSSSSSSSSSSSVTSGIFGSIFPPPSKVLGRSSLRSEVVGKRQDSAYETWNSIGGPSAEIYKSNETSLLYQDQKVHPCHLSSSIYYGGQDIYHHPQNSQSSSHAMQFKKDGTEDDSGSASRGNWWEGSLYY